jgi:hypothetical protein
MGTTGCTGRLWLRRQPTLVAGRGTVKIRATAPCHNDGAGMAS